MTVSVEARNFNWLLQGFVERTEGVTEAVAVSADGLLLASSAGRQRANVEQFAAVIAGMTSLARGAADCLDMDGLEQIIIEFSDGFLFVAAIGDGSSLGVRAAPGADLGLVGYEMTLLLNKVGSALTPALVAELKNALVV